MTIKKEDLINTKWDATKWTDDQKIKWTDYMRSLGFCVDQVEYLDENFYFLEDDYTLDLCAYTSTYESWNYEERFYEDVFPNTSEGVLSIKSEESAYYSNLDKESLLKNKPNFFKDLMDMIDYTTKMNVSLLVNEDGVSVYSLGLGLEFEVRSQEELDQVLEAIKVLEQKKI